MQRAKVTVEFVHEDWSDMTINSNSLAIWSWLSAALLAVLAATFILSPRLLLFLSESSLTLTPLEAFLALHFGIFLTALALTLVLNVCGILPPVTTHLISFRSMSGTLSQTTRVF